MLILINNVFIPLDSRLKNLRKGTSKKDLVASLSVAKEESVARFITSGCKLEAEEETELSLNPLIRHITPHLQVRNYKNINNYRNIYVGCTFVVTMSSLS